VQLITEEYCRLNQALHEENKHYGTTGQYYLADVVRLIKQLKTQDVLDYGCGKSTLAHNLPFTIKQYDPAVPKYAALPEPADVVVCTDVLEHIEPEYLESVLAHLAKLTKRVGYFTAATIPAKKTLADGRNAHLIVKPAKWWLLKMYEYFEVINFSKHDTQLILIVEPYAHANLSN
jgi:2-polyprenyl-3-methyl-5-hydroxy-6-metoxy-1,4-benzoquinol methylase